MSCQPKDRRTVVNKNCICTLLHYTYYIELKGYIATVISSVKTPKV